MAFLYLILVLISTAIDLIKDGYLFSLDCGVFSNVFNAIISLVYEELIEFRFSSSGSLLTKKELQNIAAESGNFMGLF